MVQWSIIGSISGFNRRSNVRGKLNMTESSAEYQPPRIEIITADRAGQRLDNFLLSVLRTVPKSRVYRLIRKGEVRVNGKRAKPDAKLVGQDQVRLPPLWIEQRQPSDTAKYIPILDDVLLETDHFLILNKPSGLAVHGGSGIHVGAIEALRSQRKDLPYIELAHRIDRDTSGLLVFAKKRAFLRRFQQLLREKKALRKSYDLLVHGYWPGRLRKVDHNLTKLRLASGERVARVDELGKASETEFEVIERFNGMTWLRARPITGRMHQIRVHAAASSHPIIGDPKYGDSKKDKAFRSSRMMLHASALSVSAKDAGSIEFASLNVEAPLPPDFMALVERTRAAT